MGEGVVTVEIELHEEEYGNSSFHHRYQVDKYKEKANHLEACLMRTLMEEGIDFRVLKNPGPGSFYKEHCSRFKDVTWNIKNWYVSSDRSEKIRYPRLGAFEVILKSPPGFAPPSSRLNPSVEVWSKLKTRRWPDISKLAESVARILSTARDGLEVKDLLANISEELNASAKVDTNPSASGRPSSATRNPPMRFAGRDPPQRTRELPTLHMSSSTPGSTHRPASARAASASKSAVPRLSGGDQGATWPKGLPVRPGSAVEPRHSYSLPAQPSATLTKLEGNILVAEEDGVHEDDLGSRTGQTYAGVLDLSGSVESLLPGQPALHPAVAGQADEVVAIKEAATHEPQLVEDLAKRLLTEYGSWRRPEDLLAQPSKSKGLMPDFSAPLSLDSFGEQVSGLGVFVNAPFDFAKLYAKLSTLAGARGEVTLGGLARALSEHWPPPATGVPQGPHEEPKTPQAIAAGGFSTSQPSGQVSQTSQGGGLVIAGETKKSQAAPEPDPYDCDFEEDEEAAGSSRAVEAPFGGAASSPAAHLSGSRGDGTSEQGNRPQVSTSTGHLYPESPPPRPAAVAAPTSPSPSSAAGAAVAPATTPLPSSPTAGPPPAAAPQLAHAERPEVLAGTPAPPPAPAPALADTIAAQAAVEARGLGLVTGQVSAKAVTATPAPLSEIPQTPAPLAPTAPASLPTTAPSPASMPAPGATSAPTSIPASPTAPGPASALAPAPSPAPAPTLVPVAAHDSARETNPTKEAAASAVSPAIAQPALAEPLDLEPRPQVLQTAPSLEAIEPSAEAREGGGGKELEFESKFAPRAGSGTAAASSLAAEAQPPPKRQVLWKSQTLNSEDNGGYDEGFDDLDGEAQPPPKRQVLLKSQTLNSEDDEGYDEGFEDFDGNDNDDSSASIETASPPASAPSPPTAPAAAPPNLGRQKRLGQRNSTIMTELDCEDEDDEGGPPDEVDDELSNGEADGDGYADDFEDSDDAQWR